MKRIKKSLKAAINSFVREMKGPDKQKIARNREKTIETWLSIDYADMWRPERGDIR